MSESPDGTVTLCAVLRVPAVGVAAFQAYEDAVLALLPAHGARLERRLRTPDGLTEIHVLRFPSEAALTAFRADPERLARTALFEASGATAESWIVTDADVPKRPDGQKPSIA